MFSNYLKVALRNLLRHKGYSAINILGLAVGMAACIVILLWVRFNLSFDSFHANADRTCWLYEHQDFGGVGPQYISSTLPGMGPALQEDYPEIEHFCRFLGPASLGVRSQGRLYEIKEVFTVDSSALRIFSFPLLTGDPATALQRPNSLVLSEELAVRLFGDQDPLGQVVTQGAESYTVTGVLKKLPRNSHLQFEALLSMSSLENNEAWKQSLWSNNCLITYLLLKPEASRLALERKLPGFLQKHLGEMAKSYRLLLMPVKELRMHSPTNYGKGPGELYIYLFSVIALVVLLLACINFINLSIARSGRRAREVGLRKALGASRPEIARQFLGESVLMAALALLVAVTLVELALPLLNPRLGVSMQFDYLANWELMLSLMAATLAVGLLAGGYPAAVVSSFQSSAVLKGGTTSGPGMVLLRRTLVFAQFAVSLLLITCTLVVFGQWNYMRSKELGLNASQVICLPTEFEMPNHYESFRAELLSDPVITAVTAVNFFSRGVWTSDFHYEGDGGESGGKWFVANLRVDPDFVSFFGLELVAGRGFSREMATDQYAYVINETLAGKIGWSPQEALGKQVSVNQGNLGPVIGVVKDFHFKSVVQPIEPLAIFVQKQTLFDLMVRTRPGSLTQALEFLERRWQEHFPDRPFGYTFLDQEFARRYENYEQQTLMIGTFTLLAVLLACLGLLGLIALAAESRTKEIGVRKVLGATVADILLLLSREFLLLLAAAMLIAWPVAWWVMQRWLQNFAYRIELDWLTFFLAGLIALLAAVLTIGYQALRAATTDPVKALRYE